MSVTTVHVPYNPRVRSCCVFFSVIAAVWVTAVDSLYSPCYHCNWVCFAVFAAYYHRSCLPQSLSTDCLTASVLLVFQPWLLQPFTSPIFLVITVARSVLLWQLLYWYQPFISFTFFQFVSTLLLCFSYCMRVTTVHVDCSSCQYSCWVYLLSPPLPAMTLSMLSYSPWYHHPCRLWLCLCYPTALDITTLAGYDSVYAILQPLVSPP